MRARITRSALRAALPLIAIAFVAGRGTHLQGYATNGHTWPTSTVTYYVNPQSIYVSANATISAAQTAAAGWRNQTNANINLVYGGTTSGSSLTGNGKNEVFFRNGSNGSNVAETYYWWDANGRLFDADVVLYEGAFQFFTGSGCLNGVYVEDVLTHEFGHVLGLAHSSVPGATMAPAMPTYCDLTQLTLEADDISGIQSLYPPTGNPPQNSAPVVTIATPATNSTYQAGATISFSGSANDTQDGNLSSRLTWVSSVSGTIGSGASFSQTLTAGTHVITASAADNGGLVGTRQVTVTVTATAPPPVNGAPVITITSPVSTATYVEGTPITFSGTAIDVPEGDISQRLFWTSSISGVLDAGAQFTRSLPAGTHVITVQVGDNSGLSSFKQVTIVVTSGAPPPPPVNTAPVVTILAPVSAGSYVAGASITFSGTALDVPDGDISSRLVWTSNVSGVLGTGATFTRSLPAGTHVVTVSAADSSGLTTFSQVTISVTATAPPPVNGAPVITITSPVSTATYVEGTPITFSGTAIDVPEGDISYRLFWTSSISGVLDAGAQFTRSLPAGTHLITVQVGDNSGLSSFKQVTIVVTSGAPPPPPVNTAPVVTILAPVSAGSYVAGANITFSGTALDVPDGDISSRLVWTSNVSGVLGTGATFTRSLPAGTHVVTVSAADSSGLTTVSQVTISVTASSPAANGAPVITITSPVSTGTYSAGTPITFSGTAIDVPEGDISYRLFWTSSISGVLDAGAQFMRSLPAGTHLITVQVGDNSGLSSFKQVTITVRP